MNWHIFFSVGGVIGGLILVCYLIAEVAAQISARYPDRYAMLWIFLASTILVATLAGMGFPEFFKSLP